MRNRNNTATPWGNSLLKCFCDRVKPLLRYNISASLRLHSSNALSVSPVNQAPYWSNPTIITIQRSSAMTHGKNSNSTFALLARWCIPRREVPNIVILFARTLNHSYILWTVSNFQAPHKTQTYSIRKTQGPNTPVCLQKVSAWSNNRLMSASSSFACCYNEARQHTNKT